MQPELQTVSRGLHLDLSLIGLFEDSARHVMNVFIGILTIGKPIGNEKICAGLGGLK